MNCDLSPEQQAQVIRDLENEFRSHGWRHYAGYSGRGMFGARCVAIRCPPYHASKVVKTAKRRGVWAEARQDSLGREAIVYWPALIDTSDKIGTDD